MNMIWAQFELLIRLAMERVIRIDSSFLYRIFLLFLSAAF